MLPLPWRDELRFPERGQARGAGRGAAERPSATPEQVDAAAALVRALRLDARAVCDGVDNPSLARHYAMVEVR